MCLYSRENETRLIREGDSAQIGTVHDYHGGTVKGALPLKPEIGLACFCIKEGFQLRFNNLPQAFVTRHSLAGPVATAVFREGGVNNRKVDKVEFDNTELVNFNELPQGVQILCISDGKKEIQQTVAAEPASVGVGNGNVPAGVLHRNINRIGASIGSVSLLAIAAVFLR